MRSKIEAYEKTKEIVESSNRKLLKYIEGKVDSSIDYMVHIPCYDFKCYDVADHMLVIQHLVNLGYRVEKNIVSEEDVYTISWRLGEEAKYIDKAKNEEVKFTVFWVTIITVIFTGVALLVYHGARAGVFS